MTSARPVMRMQNRPNRTSTTDRLERLIGSILALISTVLNASTLMLLLSASLPDPRPKALLGHLVRSALTSLDAYIEDTARVAQFAEQLRGARLNSEKIAQMEKLIGYNTVPLSLQIDFLEKVLAKGGEYDSLLNSHDVPRDKSRILRTIDIISSRLTKAYHDRSHYSQLGKYLEIVQRYEPAHHYWTFGDSECNGTIFLEGQHVYRLTAQHCVENTKDMEHWAMDVLSDLAVQYVAPAEYTKWRIRQESDGRPEHRSFTAPSDLPQIASDAAAQLMKGRLIISNGHGRDYSY